MILYDFLTQNKNRFMRALIERNKKAPQQCYSRFVFPDNKDPKKATKGFCVQGNMQKPKNEPERPGSLVEKILSKGKKVFEEALGHDVHKVNYEAWASLFCRDLKELEGIEAEIKKPEWKEVKDSETRERYKGIGQMFYEYDRWVLAMQYNQKGMNKVTMIYKNTGKFAINEYYHQLNVVLDWIISALKPRQETKPQETKPLLDRLDEDNDVTIDDKYQAVFAIKETGRVVEAGLIIGNTPDLNNGIINNCVTAMKNNDYSAVSGNGRLAIVRRLRKMPSEMDVIEIKMDMVNYATEFMKIMEESS